MKLQTARSIVVVVAARRKNFEEAEKRLAEYLKTDPIKFTERARMESELAKNYRDEKNYLKAAAHADEAYRGFKTSFQDSTSRARGLDDLLDSGMMAFEIYRDDGKQPEAEKTLEDLERDHIKSTLTHTDWNKSQAASILGIERSTLDRKIRTYDIGR